MSFLYKLSKLCRFIFIFVLAAFCSVIPKNKKVWVFGAWFGNSFSDNPKYLYLYVKENKKNIKTVWIYKNKKNDLLSNDINRYDILAYHYMSLKGIYYQIVASVVFVSHSASSDLNPLFISFRTKRFQLWHGTPLKKIGYDDDFQSFKLKKNIFYKLLTNEFYDYVISTSEKVSTIFSTAFDMKTSKIIKLGYPRNDVFLKKYKDDASGIVKVIYMPTYRKKINKWEDILCAKLGFDFNDVNGFLSDNNIYLSLRLHPANTAGTDFQKLVNSYSNISLSNESDIYEVINQYDCLITDYSSIMFDFVLSGKPVIFYPYDKEQYLKTERGMYFNYDDIISGGFVVDSWRDIMNVLNDIKERKKIATDNSFLSGFNDEILQNHTSCYSELLCEFVMEKIKFSDV